MCRISWPVSSTEWVRSIRRVGCINAGDRGNPRSFNWSDTPIRPREFMSAEWCHINYMGYKVCYDRTFLVGAKPTELQKEVYETVVEMNREGQGDAQAGSLDP